MSVSMITLPFSLLMPPLRLPLPFRFDIAAAIIDITP
jgi:hypothetical protein